MCYFKLMKNITFKDGGKIRLDKFLTGELPDLSRSQIQKLIKDGLVLVNTQEAVVHRFLKTGDQITIQDSKTKTKDTGFEIQDSRYEIRNRQMIGRGEPEIINETDDYLVINKPAGLVVHPAAGITEPTLIDWLIKKYPMIKNIGEDVKRPGIVHRLDKDVSGLMVIAKNQKTFAHLKKQFQEHKIKKEYLGLAYGLIKADQGQIDFALKRSKLTGRIAALPNDVDGKAAITKFEVIKRFVHYTYLKLILLTGRTHQIRVHLKAYGYPLVGDKLYRNNKLKDKFGLDRIFLHATTLGFYDLNNAWQEYHLELPAELIRILSIVNGKAARNVDVKGNATSNGFR